MSISIFFLAKDLKDSIFKYNQIPSKNIFGVFLLSGGSSFSLDIPADSQDNKLCELTSVSRYSNSCLKYK